MCTVSFVPVKGQYIFTFNRDERPERYTPHFIRHKKLAQKEIYFAQDSKSGGSWFVADSLGNVLMLFNGAFKKHIKAAAYKKSRGLILMEIAAAEDMLLCFKNISLDEIEPFSIVLFENKKLYRLTWNGMYKSGTQLLNQTSYIFSSATLYSDDVQHQRRQWLCKFLQQTAEVNSSTVFSFHAGYNANDKENGLVIERRDSCSTLSISQVVISDDLIQLLHKDLKSGQTHQQSILVKANNEISIT